MAAPPPVDPVGLWPELTELYRDHYRALVKLASLLVDDVGTCEELVQDAFVRVYRRGAAFRDAAKAPAYLRSAVLNGARSHLRRREVRRRHLASVPDPPTSPEAAAVARDDERRVLAALRTLPERQREVLTLRYFLELSEAEIAETLGVSPGAVKTHAHRGLAALATRLEDHR